MSNWFYMNRMTFTSLLADELGPNLAGKLLSMDFDQPVSFMIGETSHEILTKIQQTFSRQICGKNICDDHCVSCSLSPPIYAKLIWFVQRLLLMSPLHKPFIQQISLKDENLSSIKDKAATNDNHMEKNDERILTKSTNLNDGSSNFGTTVLVIFCFFYFVLCALFLI